MHRSTSRKDLTKTLLWVSVIGVLMLAWMVNGGTAAAQTPRPTLTPAATPTEEPSPTPLPLAQPSTLTAYTGPLLRGRVINLATGQPESGMTVTFATGGISVEVSSDDAGEYAFLHLGAADGVLNVAPSRESGVKPVTTDVWVRTRTGIETVVNLGVTSDGNMAGPIVPTVDVKPSSASDGDLMTITVLVYNSLPHIITDATVTNWLPSQVIPISIHSSTGSPYFSGNLAIAELGRLDSASSALIEIVARSTGGRTSAAVLQTSTSLFYREDVAAQPQVGGNSGSAPTVLPVTGVGLPILGLGLVIVVVLVGWMRRRVGRVLPTD